MTLGAALGWKFDNAPGISTVDGVLTAWPEDSLGPAPTEAEQAAIMAEYGAFLSTPTLADYENAIQGLVDTTATEKMFRDGVTLASYVASTNPQWAAEAQAFVAWRDAVWAYSYAELAKVQAGEREQPSPADFLTELPAIVWPD